MVNIGEVSQWVRKAVADIAAFDGNLRKIDSDAEKKAIGAFLAGNLSNEDRDYIEGFMLDRRGKAEKINGLRPSKNEERTVEAPYIMPNSFGDMSPEAIESYRKMHSNTKSTFDSDGNLIKFEVLDESGEATLSCDVSHISENETETSSEEKLPDGTIRYTNQNIKRINENELEVRHEQRDPDGRVIISRFIGKENSQPRVLDQIVKKDDEVINEWHATDDGGTRRVNVKHYAMQMDVPSGLHLSTEEKRVEFLSKVVIFEETCVDGVATRRYIDADGNELYVEHGTYTKENGYLEREYPTE